MLIWKRLCLRGFGRYRDEVALVLGPGVNTLVEGNERGKSTLVYGLEAVLFGLPGSSSPELFGRVRFRNWEGSSRFDGAVELEVDGTDYRIERNFDTHQVRLLSRSGEVWVEEIVSTQNPRARKRAISYEERIRDLLGISSREVFEATFCVGQPLPEGSQVNDEVQRLLSGAGSGHYSAALEKLVADLKEVTQRTGDLGVTPRNGTKPRLVEEVEADRTDLLRGIEESRGIVDSLQGVQDKLQELQVQRKKYEGVLQEKQCLLDAWTRWQAVVSKKIDAVREQSAFQRAYQRADPIFQEIANGRTALRNDFPEFIGASDDVGERLQELEGLERELAGAKDQLEQQESELAARLGEARAQKASARKPGRRIAPALIVALIVGLGVWFFASSFFVDLSPAIRGVITLFLGLGAGGGAWAVSAGLARDRSVDGRVLELEKQLEGLRSKSRELGALDENPESSARQADEVHSTVGSKTNEVRTRRESLVSVLEAAGGETAAARRRYREWKTRVDEVHGWTSELAGLLQGQGVPDIEALLIKVIEAGNRARSALDKLEQLNTELPGLPSPEEAENSARLEARYRSLDNELKTLKESLTRVDAETRMLLEQQSRLQGRDPLNVAQAEIELAEQERELDRLNHEAEAIALAHRELTAAVKEYQESHRERLAGAATGYFVALTGVPGRRVTLDDRFNLSVLEEDGRRCALAQLSQGARDQLYLALRLAIADLMAQEVRLPFIFDDPFHNCDAQRLDHIRDAVTRLGQERQVLLLSHREELASWGRRVSVEVNSVSTSQGCSLDTGAVDCK